jgi:hypothetical protein
MVVGLDDLLMLLMQQRQAHICVIEEISNSQGGSIPEMR